MMPETRRCARTMEIPTSLTQTTTTTMQAQQAPEMILQTRRCARTVESCTNEIRQAMEMPTMESLAKMRCRAMEMRWSATNMMNHLA